jgi:transketolase
MVGDISHGILQPFARNFPDRYFNVGILEPTMVSMGAGLARVGLYPVLHTIAPFLIERSFEQLKLDFCYHRLHGNIVTVGSAFDYAYLGCTHHCYGDLALLKTLEGTQILYPSSCTEFDLLFRETYRNQALTVFRVPGNSHGVEFEPNQIKLGKGIRVIEGNDVTIVALGPQLANAIKAADLLRQRGRSAEVIYIHTVRPLDESIIRSSVVKTARVIVLEEHMRSGGLADDVLRACIGVPMHGFYSVSLPDTFVRRHASYADHCDSIGLSPERIVESIRREFGL